MYIYMQGFVRIEMVSIYIILYIILFMDELMHINWQYIIMTLTVRSCIYSMQMTLIRI